MPVKQRIISILFSDTKGFSKINNDSLYKKLNNISQEFERQFLTPDNHFLLKRWGDAYLICSYDPVDIVDLALNLRDKFRNTNWKRLGFSENLMVRIGLHTEKASIIIENGTVKDILGKNVNAAARIEPIVEPGQIFCSDTLFRHLQNEMDLNFKFIHIGRSTLAKDFGEMDLYKLIRDYENLELKINDTTPQIRIPETKIRRKVTDKDLHDFLKECFEYIVSYFNSGIKQIEASNADIETNFERVHSQKIQCKIYVNCEFRSGCQIWIGSEFLTNSILYSQGEYFADNSYNESIQVEHDGFEMFVKPLMGHLLYSGGAAEKLKLEKAAVYLWERFIEHLQY